MQIPASALFRHADGWAVYTYSDGRARRRSVGIGHRNGLAAEIISGLGEGEAVIRHPDDRIGDGVRVSAHRNAPST